MTGRNLWIGRSHLWRSGLRKDPGEATQAIDDMV